MVPLNSLRDLVALLKWPPEKTIFSKTLWQQNRRPSKCPKLYTNRIYGKQNLRQEVRKFGQNSNCNQMMYVIKYTLRVQFLI